MNYEFPYLSRFISYRIGLLRSLRRWLLSIGIGGVRLDQSVTDFWELASHHIPYFSHPISVQELDERLGSWDAWVALKENIQPNDQIHPFAINVDTMAMRLGFVVLRKGKPIGGIVQIRS